MNAWDKLGVGYPEVEGLATTPARKACFDVLAPLVRPMSKATPKRRVPIYELGHEETPTPEEVWELACNCADAVIGVLRFV